MSNVHIFRTKAELRLQEFNSKGVWDWTFPQGRPPPVPRPTPLDPAPYFMTAHEYYRMETQRVKAQKILENKK